MLAITVGAGLKQPVGKYQAIDGAAVQGLASYLASLPPAAEAWWSGHLWKDNKRSSSAWLATTTIVIDIDYVEKGDPHQEHAAHLVKLADGKRLFGSVFHLTPHGARVGVVLADPCSDKKQFLTAAAACDALVSQCLAGTGYRVDVVCTKDLARLYYQPNAIAKGVARHAEVKELRAEPYTIDELVKAAPKFDDAAAHWVHDHARDYDKAPGECPVCKGSASFHALPKDATKWFCFSTKHTAGGKQGDAGWYGDALDLEAFKHGVKPADILKRDGYCFLASETNGTHRNGTNGRHHTNGEARSEETPASEESPLVCVWRPHSYLTACDIIGRNIRNVLERRQLRLNEMTGRLELGDRLMRDVDVSRIRQLIEGRFIAGVDKNDKPIGLQLSQADVFGAVEQVATARAYHPVREYLQSLKWDGVKRIDAAVEDILGAPRTPLNQAMFRRFMIAAVARAMQPGCKHDVVFILIGPQGIGKSSFFRRLAVRWFGDSPVDIHSKDSYQVLRGIWIYEWAELESLHRARDASAAKAFITSAVDTYRPSYGRLVIDVPRAGVLVGSSNQAEFLTDDENRRFWPLAVSSINLALLGEQKDQLWAEAYVLYLAGEPWHLSQEEETQLRARHTEHEVRDPWESEITAYAEQTARITVSDVLEHVLRIPIGKWTASDQKRVIRCLRRAGCIPDPYRPHGGKRTWRAPVQCKSASADTSNGHQGSN